MANTTGKRVRTNDLFIMSDKRQLEMLERAVNVALDYYNGIKIVV